MTAQPPSGRPAGADVEAPMCPECGDGVKYDDHMVTIRCKDRRTYYTSFAALRAERDSLTREKEQLEILARSMLAGGTDWMQKAHEAQKDAFALQKQLVALRARAERAEAALREIDSLTSGGITAVGQRAKDDFIRLIANVTTLALAAPTEPEGGA